MSEKEVIKFRWEDIPPSKAKIFKLKGQ